MLRTVCGADIFQSSKNNPFLLLLIQHLIHSTMIACIFIRRKFKFYSTIFLCYGNRCFSVVFLTMRKNHFPEYRHPDTKGVHISIYFSTHNSVSSWCRTHLAFDRKNCWKKKVEKIARDRLSESVWAYTIEKCRQCTDFFLLKSLLLLYFSFILWFSVEKIRKAIGEKRKRTAILLMSET